MKARIQSTQWASSTQRNRLSRRTSCSIGTALVTPGDVPEETWQTLAAVQLKRLRHRRSHALRTSSLTFSGADSALACESAPRTSAVSPDHLPPTSAPKTTRACASSFTHQLGVGSLLSPRSIFQCRATVVCRPPACHPVPLQRGHHRCVDGSLGAVENGQTVNNDLQAPGINRVAAFHVEVPHHDITAFFAHLRSCSLKCKSPCSHPRLRARCLMVATAVEETATSASAGGEGKREVEATAQQRAEWLRVDAGRPRCGECHQKVAGKRPLL